MFVITHLILHSTLKGFLLLCLIRFEMEFNRGKILVDVLCLTMM